MEKLLKQLVLAHGLQAVVSSLATVSNDLALARRVYADKAEGKAQDDAADKMERDANKLLDCAGSIESWNSSAFAFRQ